MQFHPLQKSVRKPDFFSSFFAKWISPFKSKPVDSFSYTQGAYPLMQLKLDHTFEMPAPNLYSKTFVSLKTPEKSEEKSIKTSEKPTQKSALLKLYKTLQQEQKPTKDQAVDILSQKEELVALFPHITFEDLLMKIMMKIAQDEERQVLAEIESMDEDGQGINAFLNRSAEAAGAFLGGGLFGYLGGEGGVAMGQDVGRRTARVITGSNSQESRQIRFEKLKMKIQKLSEMMTCISNILTSNHQTARNTISNIR